MKILVVDDSKAMRSIVMRTLRQAGYGDHTILEAATGAEALTQIRAQKPDLVLSDWNMPEMSGIDFLTTLRASGGTVPFGFVTSEGSPAMRAQAEAAGAAFLIAKPFTPESFDEALGAVLGAHP